MSDFDRKDWDQDSKGPENIESNRKEQDPDRYKEVTDCGRQGGSCFCNRNRGRRRF